MCNYPEKQEELFEQLKDVPQTNLLRVPLLKGVIKESLRLYPIAPFISRYLPKDSVIGNYFVAKGVSKSVLLSFAINTITCVIYNKYILHVSFTMNNKY